MRQFFDSRPGRLAIILAAAASVIFTGSVDTLGSWALVVPALAALGAAVAALRLHARRKQALLYALASGIGTFVFFPFAFAFVAFAVLAAYAAIGLFCVLIDLAGLPSGWCV